MNEGLRFRLRSWEESSGEKRSIKELQLFGDLPWCAMCRSPYKTSIILDAREWAEIGRLCRQSGSHSGPDRLWEVSPDR